MPGQPRLNIVYAIQRIDRRLREGFELYIGRATDFEVRGSQHEASGLYDPAKDKILHRVKVEDFQTLKDVEARLIQLLSAAGVPLANDRMERVKAPLFSTSRVASWAIAQEAFSEIMGKL